MVSKIGVVLVLCVASVVDCIISHPGESKVTGKSSEPEKKADQLDAQSSHSHSVYGGFGDNGIGTTGGFGGTGLGSFGGGDGGYGYHHYGDHGHHDVHHEHHHKHHDDGGYHKSLAIKGLLIPLAGVALLGAAAAFVSNPILLQLGVISGTYAGRKRREASHGLDLDESAARLEAQSRLNQIQILERFMAQVPKEEIFSQEKKLMANYLSCSGVSEQNTCLERLACELQGPQTENMSEETHVMSIILGEIFSNDLVPTKIKEKMTEAVQVGQEGGNCSRYTCRDMENYIRQKIE